MEIRLGFVDEFGDLNGPYGAILVGPIERLYVFRCDFAAAHAPRAPTLTGTYTKFLGVNYILTPDPDRVLRSVSLFFGLNAVAR